MFNEMTATEFSQMIEVITFFVIVIGACWIGVKIYWAALGVGKND